MKRLTCAIAAFLALGQIATAQVAPQDGARHVLRLDDVEISALIDDVSIITGYTFILHPDVRRARVTVMSQAPLTTDEVFQVFLSTLRVNGFAAVPAGNGVYRILPEADAVGQAGIGASGPNAFVTQVIQLRNSSAADAASMLKPLIDPQGQVVANSKSNSLIVVDYASNMSRLRQVVADLDSDERTRVETLSLQSVPAKEMESILSDLLGRGEGNGAPFQVRSSQTSNSIILRGDDETVSRALAVAQRLDASDPARDRIRVIPLNNADAREIVPILEKIAASMSVQEGPGADSVPSTISHHEPSNSLIISADPDTLMAMERVVESLDQRRAQVLVEAIIVEMSDDTARELGVQFLLAGTESSTTPFASTNFSRSAPNLLALAGALAGDNLFGSNSGDDSTTTTNPFQSAAVNSLLGLTGLSVGVGGQSGDSLFGAIITAVENDTESRVLSKPFNMTLDNGTSSLVVGQEIPITTGEVLGDANTNPFRTVNRQKVGVKLTVTPRISNDDTVRMDIYQEVSSIFGSITVTTPDFITNTREISTSVLADDGEIIVLGGLIEQSDVINNSKVPILGDVPVVGNL